ncbi:helix-turn-helix transcriptional regulator [Pseudoalteromonas sp. SG45-5]|uniref:helix-turn-helix domain-containing protein n=1 Tax=unclassified Pseudoalteromonas TaxID=194690 RepID=UPI0015F7C694|nr:MULTISPECIES: helix-turn-helix transcriptional regulator [unclassified Pseudoalteromonas]MBB1386375.1 helix-turn-helix transcriptional regulator [Pseudoalteromonas sp. SG45-5]MBB1394297.1 helix-turn-helix transcriptional regulator [Pseudoalteromonas sp. SG44-4]MBB1447924.1 helix-turn-helix transcriptional regulator [Pseudoalteromonas sp. SG41-6]
MKTNNGSPFPKRLKEARMRKGFSQKQLGILAGVDSSSASPRMNQYEKGVHTPDFQMVRALAKVLEVPTAFLFCEEDYIACTILKLKK